MSNNNVGTELCGSIEYRIEAVTYTESVVKPLVVLSLAVENTFVLQPSAEFSAGLYGLNLIGTLVDYPTVSKSEPFTVKVLPCSTILSAADVTEIIVAENLWF